MAPLFPPHGTAVPARGPRRRRPLLLVALALVGTACEQPAVSWIDDESVATTLPSPLEYPPFIAIDSALQASSRYAEFLLTQDRWREAGGTSLLEPILAAMPEAQESLDAPAPLPTLALAPTPLTALGRGDEPADSLRCARSVRIVSAGARGVVAVWWSRGTGSRVRLMAAWRDSVRAPVPDSAGGAAPLASAIASPIASAIASAGNWRGPMLVDSLDQGPGDAQAADRGAYGCARPAPSVVVDKTNGYVHVAYSLTGPEGPGVFYAHQMDPRSPFEPPVAIVYGERIGDARVAVAGNVVAVAYEDPNSGGGRRKIGLAISRSAGHLFEARLIASGATSNARDPHVLVRGRAVVVGWSETTPTGSPSTFRLRRARVEP